MRNFFYICCFLLGVGIFYTDIALRFEFLPYHYVLDFFTTNIAVTLLGVTCCFLSSYASLDDEPRESAVFLLVALYAFGVVAVRYFGLMG